MTYEIGQDVYVCRPGDALRMDGRARGKITHMSGERYFTYEVTTPNGEVYYAYYTSIEPVSPLTLLAEESE